MLIINHPQQDLWFMVLETFDYDFPKNVDFGILVS